MASKKPPRRCYRCFCWLCRFLVVLCLICGFGVIQGIPGPWVVSVLNHLRPVPGLLELGDVVWRPDTGWMVRQVVWYSPKDLTRPLVQAEQVSWKPGRGGEASVVHVQQGRLATELGMWTGRLGVKQPVELSDVEGEIHWDADRISLQGVRLLFSGIRVQLNGTLDKDEDPKDQVRDGESSVRVLERFTRSLVPVVQGLESYSSTTTPVLHIDVSGQQVNPTLAFHLLQAEDFQLRGNAFSSLRCAGRLEDRVLTVEQLEVVDAAQERLSGGARVDFRNRMFDLRLENTLDREALEALSPVSIDGLLSTIDLRLEGEASFQMRVGPASFDSPGERIRGSFTVQDALYREAFFSTGTFEVDWDTPYLRMPAFSGTFGEGAQAGSVSGSLELQMETGLFRLNLDGAADPAQAVSLVGAEVESIIREWEFQGPPPEFRLEVEVPDAASTAKVQLVARAERAVWRGTLFQHLRAVTSLDEHGLRIRDVTATRANHLLEGSFEFPPDLSSCTFSITSSFPLPDLLPLLGQKAVDVVRSVRFLGATRFSAAGTVDFTEAYQHDLSGEAHLEKVALNWVWFEKLSSRFAMKGQQLDLPDIEGETVGGTLSGSLRITDLFESDGRFDTDLTIRQVDLFELITRATDTTETPYTGILGLDLVMGGRLYDTLETRRTTTLDGEGRIQIRQGELFRIPLLLGLSSILNKVTTGFGYASQGDLDADFVIRNGKLSSKNVLVGGSVMSIAGTGGYNFTTREIDGNVKVQLLKDGFMSDALKVLLWPIRKLIEVSLTGTLDNPDWRPRNLPKELFGK